MYHSTKSRFRQIFLTIFFLTLVTTVTAAEKTSRIIIKYSQPVLQMGVFSAQAAIAQRELSLKSMASSTGSTARFKRTSANGAEIYEFDTMINLSEVDEISQQIAQNPNVEYAEPDRILHTMFTPNDSRYNEQWHYHESTGGLNVPGAWDSVTGAGVVVAVIDTGYLPHQDLVGNIVGGYDMISSSDIAADGNGRDSNAVDPGDNGNGGGSFHGTHVAGTVAAITGNNLGVAGVSFDAKVLPVRVLGVGGGFTSDIADGIIWASGGNVPGVPNNPNPAQVINMSLGGGGACGFTSQNAINIARANGTTVVVAAGNSSQDASSSNPANCEGVITVAATNRSGSKAEYSNFGSVIDVAAPGGETRSGQSGGVLSTLSNDGYAFYQGTSMAAPHVAGLAALLYQAKPGITPDEVESIIKDTARPFPGTCSQCGTGIADALAAVNAATGGVTPPPPPTGDNELQNGVTVTGLSGANGNNQFFTLNVPAGASNLSIRISGGSGDADLYVRFNNLPTTDIFDCRPYIDGNNEICTFPNVQQGTYHVMIRGYTSYSETTVTAQYTEVLANQPVVLEETELNSNRLAWKYYTITVPQGYDLFNVTMSGGTGDADLYVKRGSKPTISSYDCRPYKGRNDESCQFNKPAGSVWHIGIRAYQAFSGVTLKAVAKQADR